VLSRLAADPATRERPIIALSASALPDEVSRAVAAGALEYWTKPIDFDVFVKGMRRLLAT
jgi:CheY-like chemotaxis protein